MLGSQTVYESKFCTSTGLRSGLMCFVGSPSLLEYDAVCTPFLACGGSYNVRSKCCSNYQLLSSCKQEKNKEFYLTNLFNN